MDPSVRIEQVLRYHFSRFGNTPWSGRSNGVHRSEDPVFEDCMDRFGHRLESQFFVFVTGSTSPNRLIGCCESQVAVSFCPDRNLFHMSNHLLEHLSNLRKNIGKTPRSSVPVLSAQKPKVFPGFFAFLANCFGFLCLSMPVYACRCCPWRNHPRSQAGSSSDRSLVICQARNRRRAAGILAGVPFAGWPASNGTIVANPRCRGGAGDVAARYIQLKSSRTGNRNDVSVDTYGFGLVIDCDNPIDQ